MSVSGPSQSQSIVYTQIAQDEIYLDTQAERSEETADLYIDTGTPILPEDISTFYSLNFPNLSAVSATDCNIQSFTTISSGIAPEAELTVSEDKGVNTSTRDLVLAAISVMKGRKARPDTKRICNWVNRKYGRSVQEVVQQIDDLCQQSILEKVDYKGSISFRITSEKKLHKRVGRRKNSSLVAGSSLEQPPGENRVPSKPARASSPRKNAKGAANRNKDAAAGGAGANSAVKMDPVTLNLILREELKLAPDDLVTKENIISALEMTDRPINKRAVYRDLETILAHEIHLGYLVKHQEGNSYILASINKHKHYRGTIPLKSSKRKPKPTQKILEMEAGMQKNKQEKYSEYVTFDSEGNIAQTGAVGARGGEAEVEIKDEPNLAEAKEDAKYSEVKDDVSGLKSEEELKDELIKETLINNSLMKMKSKPKSGKGKHKKEAPVRSTSVQGPILSVPTPYSSITSIPASCSPASCPPDSLTSFNYTSPVPMQQTYSPAPLPPPVPVCSPGMGQPQYPVISQPLAYSGIPHQPQSLPPGHPVEIQQNIPQAHAALRSPNVEILPVLNSSGTQTKPRLPVDELSMTTIQQEEKKVGIVPIKPKVKKETWQVSITVKEGKSKPGSIQPEISIPQVPTSMHPYSNNVTPAHSTPSFPSEIKTELVMKKESGMLPGNQPIDLHHNPHDGNINGINSYTKITELPHARKTRVTELKAMDLSKTRNSTEKCDETSHNKPNESVENTDNVRPAKVTRKRSMDKKEDLQKEMETRNAANKGTKKAKTEVEEIAKQEVDENKDNHHKDGNDDKGMMRRRPLKQAPNRDELDNQRKISMRSEPDVKPDLKKNGIKTANVPSKMAVAPSKSILNKPAAVARKQPTPPPTQKKRIAGKGSDIVENNMRSKRSLRHSSSPEPDEEGGEETAASVQQEDRDQPQLETRTSSGRRKRARKIFDPADHDVPSRIIKKCRTVSPVSPKSPSSFSTTRSSRSDSTDLPQTNGLKELIQPVEELSPDEEEEEEVEEGEESCDSPTPPPLQRSSRRGGGANLSSSDFITKNSQESTASNDKGRRTGSQAQNQSAASIINGTRRRSRDLVKPSQIDMAKKDKQTAANSKVKADKSMKYESQNSVTKPTKIGNQGNNKKEKETKVKEESQFKVPQRPVNKHSPNNVKSKKNKGGKASLNSFSKHGKNKSSKNQLSSKSNRGGSQGRVADEVEEVADTKDIPICIKCEAGHKKSEKLIFCKDCGKTIHPKCLNYPEELTDRIYGQPWQCIDCKLCTVCIQPGNDDKLLFCDSCDQAYHMCCHRPAILRTPRGRWECDTCAAHTGFKGEEEDKLVPAGADTFFEELLPALPPGVSQWPHLGSTHRFCPANDQYPPNWEELPIDPSVPDISDWSPARMSQFLVQNGIKETVAKVFFDQEIDGASVLVLTRGDVLHSLGLKLGPALKVYQHIKRLQTRRNFSLLPQ